VKLSRETESELIQFCVEQRESFNYFDWEKEHSWPKDYSELASHLLSGVGSIPKTFSKQFPTQSFEILVIKYHFDCSRFFHLMERQPNGGLV